MGTIKTDTGEKESLKTEFKKITWLSGKKVVRQALWTAVITAVMSAVISLADSGALNFLGKLL